MWTRIAFDEKFYGRYAGDRAEQDTDCPVGSIRVHPCLVSLSVLIRVSRKESS